jgi:hypothetical protein
MYGGRRFARAPRDLPLATAGKDERGSSCASLAGMKVLNGATSLHARRHGNVPDFAAQTAR